jgi:hypothetical protein
MSIQIESDWWKSLFDEVYLMTDARSVRDDALTTMSSICAEDRGATHWH